MNPLTDGDFTEPF